MATENKSLGKFILDGILPAPRGLPQIEVTFDIDANGILNVSAKDKATGKEQKIVIQASSGLAKNEIDQMVRDAEQHAEEDRLRREEIEDRNRADTLAYQAEKLIRESGEQLPAQIKADIEEKTKVLRDALTAGEIGPIREHMQTLQTTMTQAGQAVYEAQQAQAGANGQTPDAGEGEPGAAGSAGTKPGTVEGEFREV